MTTYELQPGYSTRPQRPACARFLPGDDAADWIEDIASWDVPQADLELFLVPRSPADPRPRGLLVRLPESFGNAPGRRGLAYGVVGGKLFVPVEATITPVIAEEEWAELLREGYAAWVWHPQSGLVALEEPDRLRVSDLIEPPPEIETDWGRARDGEFWSSRIESIDVERPQTVEDILAEGRDEIGTQSDDLKTLPRSPGEGIGKTLGDIGAAAISPIARAAKWLADHTSGAAASAGAGSRNAGSGSAAGKTWMNSLSEWADEVLKRGADLWNARKKELDRLMSLLESDPDEGLKYALPMGQGAPRGLAPPGTRLTRRSVDFSLRPGSGGSADYWELPPDYEMQLLARYRELAAREVRLGRHRRAAYIYAELLNDLNAAANTLRAGKHYREAAVLFRDKLKRPHDAAKCLEQGGLLHEAIEIYDELQQHVKVAELYTQLQQLEDARQAYCRAVDERLKHGDRMTAARLLEEKLYDADNALAVLEAGWPDSGQARDCLDESFRLLARLGRHDRAAERVLQLRDDPPGPAQLRHLTDGLAEAAEAYPDDRVRAAAADATRVVTSRALVAGHNDPERLLRAVERLTPRDRLLTRDCRRHLRTRRRDLKAGAAPTSPRSPLRIPIDFVRTIPIPHSADWVSARGTSRGFYIAGYGSRELLLVRGAWAEPKAELTIASWKSRLLSGNPLLMSIDEHAPNSVRLFVPGGPAIPQRFLRPTPHSPPGQFAETPGWVSDGTIGMDSCGGVSWVLEFPFLVLKCIDHRGVVVSSTELSPPAYHESAPVLQRPLTPAQVHARENGVYVAHLNRLHCVTRTGHREHTFDQEIQSIAGTALHTRPRLALLFEQGGMAMWPKLEGDEFTPLPDSLIDPRAAFLRDGRLIVCDDRKWVAYSTRRERLQLEWEYHAPVRDVMAVLPTPAADEFAVVAKSGHVAIYRAK